MFRADSLSIFLFQDFPDICPESFPSRHMSEGAEAPLLLTTTHPEVVVINNIDEVVNVANHVNIVASRHIVG